jgi:diguanylate cyclase (GGDEF)-like protein/PAS domain S-box-containing protein
MIWPSVMIMTLVDVLIVGACFYALWSHSRFLSIRTLGYGALLVQLGLAAIGLFFVADFLAMHVLPFFVSTDEAMAVTMRLRAEYAWYFALLGVASIVAGLVSNAANVSALIAKSEQREARFRDVAEVAGDWIWEMDENLHFTYLSDRFFEIFPLSSEQILGKPRGAFASSVADNEAWRQYFDAVINRRAFRDFEYPVTLPNGVTRHISVNGKPTFDADGTFRGYRGTGADKTPEAEARTALEKSEKHYRDLIEGSIQGLYIHKDWTSLFANQALADILGYQSPDEILALGRAEPLVAPEDRERLWGYVLARRSGEYAPEIYEARAIKKDGSTIWLEFRVTPVDWQDQPAMQCALVDITDRKTAEAQLNEQKLHLDAAVRNITQGLVMYDANARLVVWNQRYVEMHGISPEFMKVGRSYLDLMKHRKEVGVFGSDPDAHCQRVLARVAAKESWSRIIELPDGKGALQVIHRTLSDGGWVSTHEDITERLKTEETLKLQNEQFTAALENMSEGLCMYDADKRLIVSNERYASLYNLRPEQIKPGMTLNEVVSLRYEQGSHPEVDIENYIEERQEWFDAGAQDRKVRKLGNGRVIGITNRVMSNGGWLAIHADITEAKHHEDRIAFMAHHDALTKLPNRALLQERMEDELKRARRGQGFSLLVLDLDGFKEVNDTFGHPAGDELLKAVADRLRACVREIDTVARLGGDEFAIIQTETSETDNANRLAERICEAIAAPFTLGNDEAFVGTSIGVAKAPKDGLDPDELLKKADMALYEAKRDGRGRYRFYGSEHTSTLQ